MAGLVLAVLLGLLAVGVAMDVLRDRARRAEWDRERRRSHEHLMREVRRHGSPVDREAR